ncbi:MAG: 50S ribosomal protein L4 [archaeon]
MKADVIDLQGKKTGSIDLPNMFSAAYRPDIIKRAFLSYTSWNYQHKGADRYAGQQTSAQSWGTGSGRSIMPRMKIGPHRGGRNAKGHRYRSKGRWFSAAGRYAIAPGTTGGRQAHPPKAQKIIIRHVNNKEMDFAIASAVAATTIQELVKARGHAIDEKLSLPFIVDDSLESLKKTKEALEALNALGLKAELARCSETKVRCGRGKTRGRKYKRKVGPLIVVSDEKGIESAARNIPGVDITTVDDLNIELLAPGANAGRFTIWTKSAVEQLAGEVKK